MKIRRAPMTGYRTRSNLCAEPFDDDDDGPPQWGPRPRPKVVDGEVVETERP